MSDEQQRHPHAPAEGGWQPIPRGAEMDAEGTTFFQIPPELLADPAPGGWAPLAAPGTGYAPPVANSWQQHPEPQPHPAPGQAPTDWVRDDVYGHVGAAPAGGAAPADVHGHGADIHGHEHGHLGGAVHMDGQAPLNAHPDPSADAMAGAAGPVDRDADPHATAQWPMPFASDEGAGSTGQWSVPAAGDDPVEESGEYRLRENVPAPAAPVEPSHAEIMAEAWRQPLAAAAPVAVPVPEPALAATGEHQWSVPAAPVETVDESGEYALSSVHDDGTHRAAHGDADGITGTGEIPTGSWTTGGGAAEPATQPAVEAEPAAAAAPEAPAKASVDVPVDVPADVPVEAPAVDMSAADVPPVEVPPVEAPVAEPAQATEAAEFADVAELPAEATEPPAAPHNEHPCASYVLSVNGTDRPVTDAWIGESLLYVLRERLGLAGAKDGCSQGECGACSVQVDGRLVASCLVPAATTAGSEIRTVEGLAAAGQPSDVQRALADCGAVQCGFCVPGLAMTVHDLLEGNHAPTELETRQAICGNLCRCSGYRGVLDAVRQVVDERAEAAAAQEEAQAQHPDAEATRIPHQAGPYSDGPYSDGGGNGTGRAMA
ncbi:aerobic-type carbon monoxide dehydrogenase small subunit (CoxS/CutS family) [Streptomyces olivoverticillatus]|uniref:Aerobic-type carbon monoxide dehydrogenase small subunit (CoxS/CutS family) n=1 Tax=Streptomyces olivoverticillatus TaxID=66427 RepID=A0A7W7PK94_9ACTN|nr:aerobic-type carbon monoxide dehydrogenase small subunit (CoxS/CutS family) [Streptomyces olivoverticillatus]